MREVETSEMVILLPCMSTFPQVQGLTPIVSKKCRFFHFLLRGLMDSKRQKSSNTRKGLRLRQPTTLSPGADKKEGLTEPSRLVIRE